MSAAIASTRIPPSTLAAIAMFAALLLAACDSPVSDGGDGKGKPDSLDAELGKDQLNRYDFLQGSFLSTGQVMDLAIEGKGLFILKNLEQFVYFRRPGMFSQDAEGYLHLGNTRTRLQGVKLYSDTNPWPLLPAEPLKPAFKDLVDVRWPFDDLAPPRATTVVKLARNLDSDALGKGSVLYTQKFMHHAQDPDLLVGLYDRSGNALGIKAGDVLTLSAVGNGTPVTMIFEVQSTSTLAQLANALTTFLRSSSVGAGPGTTVDLVTAADSETLRGALTVYGNTAAINNLQITSNRPVSGPNVTKAFALPTLLPAGSGRLANVTEILRYPAQAADLVSEVFDAVGNPLGLEEGDRITFSGALGDETAQNVPILVFASRETTMQALIDRIKDNFKLPNYDGTLYNNRTVSLNAAGTDDNVHDGSILIRGMPGGAFDIRDVSIRSTDMNNSKPSPNFFNTNMNITTLRSATDALIGKCSVDLFDATGKPHPLTVQFSPSNFPGSWLFEASMEKGMTLEGATRGTLRFGADGSVAEATSGTLTFDPGNGTAPVKFTLDFGRPGDFTGITQFRSAMSVAAVEQDGFAPGRLTAISIGEDGIISGAYSNGKTRPLFQLPLAGFPNPKGLRQVGDNSFLESPESGKPAVTMGGAIRAGAVEFLSEAEKTRVCALYPGC
jgi:flagellar hook-basal body protein